MTTATDAAVAGGDAPDEACRARDRWARFFAAALVAATLANGAAPYLKRIGVIERQRYEAYWRIHCGGDEPVSRPWGLGRRCAAFEPGPLTPARFHRERSHLFFVFEVRPSEVPLKLVKDAVMLLFVGVSFWQSRRDSSPPYRAGAAPLWGLCVLVVLASAWGIAHGDRLRTLVGLRGTTFIAVALFGVWMTDVSRLQHICRALIALLVIQLLLVPGELLWGMPMAGYASVLALPSRVAGTLVKANGLGVLAAVTVAFAECYTPDRRLRITAWGGGILVVLFAGSATGWIVLFALFVARIVHRNMPWRSIAALSSIVVLLLLALPVIVGRPNLLHSLTAPAGRFDLLRGVLSRTPILFGGGLGAGTNAEQVLLSQGTQLEGAGMPASDSTAIVMLSQFGILGALLFYAAFAVAWRRQPRLTPLFLALGLTSLSFDLPEAFPLNLVLGLALAHGCARPASTSRQ
jgi:hypothetical protein